MSADILNSLAQLRALLKEIHTSGDDTMIMAGSRNLLEQIIQLIQDESNVQAKNDD